MLRHVTDDIRKEERVNKGYNSATVRKMSCDHEKSGEMKLPFWQEYCEVDTGGSDPVTE